MKRLTTMLMGLSLLVLATGCCGWPHGYGSGYGGCPTGACGVGGGGGQALPPQGAFYNGYSTTQIGSPVAPAGGPITAATPGYPAGFQTAMGPLESLPTY